MNRSASEIYEPAAADAPRVLIAMSGGVDSSVAALLLRREGLSVEGAMMRLSPRPGEEEPAGTPGTDDPRTAGTKDPGRTLYASGEGPADTASLRPDERDAAAAAAAIGIPFRVISLTGLFRERVIDRFVREYEAGRTPNPCIDCNRGVKFGRFLELALAEGFDAVATGHYARVRRDPATGLYGLYRAADPARDQSYVLAMLSQEQLAHVRFPLGELTKPRVREIAEENGLANARKHDSQDICFIPDGDYVRFLESVSGKTYPPGPFVDPDGRVLGTHRGAVRYTPGQRRGLGLSVPEPVYVYAKDMEANIVRVGPERLVFSRTFTTGPFSWIAGEAPREPVAAEVVTRYHKVPAKALVTPRPDGTAEVLFEEPQRAVTPGQWAVAYDGDRVLGGGVIDSVEGGPRGA